jgi:hypothetical protein
MAVEAAAGKLRDTLTEIGFCYIGNHAVLAAPRNIAR